MTCPQIMIYNDCPKEYSIILTLKTFLCIISVYTYLTLNLTVLLPPELELGPANAGKFSTVFAMPVWPLTVLVIVTSGALLFLDDEFVVIVTADEGFGPPPKIYL